MNSEGDVGRTLDFEALVTEFAHIEDNISFWAAHVWTAFIRMHWHFPQKFQLLFFTLETFVSSEFIVFHVSWDSIFISPVLQPCSQTGWSWITLCSPEVLTQGTSAETVVCSRLGLGLVAIEDLLHELFHWEPWTAVAIAACPLDAMNCKENSKISHQKLQNRTKTIKNQQKSVPAAFCRNWKETYKKQQ